MTFYSVESPTEEKEENLSEGLTIPQSKSTFVGVRKLYFIYSWYEEPDIRQKLLDRMNVFWQEPTTKFHEAAIKLYMKIGYGTYDFFATDI